MAFLKKAAALITAMAALSALTSLCSFSASAYDDCDVNHDGDVDVSDLVAISQYLAGDLYCADYNRFDTNKSLTVDESDYDKIMANIMGYNYQAKYWNKYLGCTVTDPTVSGFSPDPDASSTTARTYRRYSFTQHQELSSYTLTPTTSSLGTSNSPDLPRHIIEDNQHFSEDGAENVGIVKIGSGTGFIIGKHVIATAAHVVYWDGAFYTSHTINLYNADGTISNQTLTPLEAHMPAAYTIAGDYINDYALITVSEDLTSRIVFKLGTTYNLSALDYASIPIYLLGLHLTGSGSDYTNLYYSSGHVLDVPAYSNDFINFTCDIRPGNSGSPVYTVTKLRINGHKSYKYTVIAICNYQSHPDVTPPYNGGTRITKYHLQFFTPGTNPYIYNG